MTQHTFQVHLARAGQATPIDGGTITFEGHDYDTFDEEQALTELLPGGTGPHTLDLSLEGYVRWRGILMPSTEFERLEVTLVSKST